MRGRIWLSYFFRTIRLAEEPASYGEQEWRRFFDGVMSLIAARSKCYVALKGSHPKGEQSSREYLNLDAIFLDLAEYGLTEARDRDWDPLVLPRAVVEMVEDHDRHRIAYSLWKVLCVRSPVRALMCSQKDAERVASLARYLEDVVWRGSMMKATDSDLLVLIGDDSLGEDVSWEDYYSVYEWRNDSLQPIRAKEEG